MSSLKKSEKILISIVVILLLIFILSKVSIFPYRSSMIKLKEEVENSKDQLEYATKIEKTIVEKKENLNSLRKKLKACDGKLPTEKREPEIAKKIKELADKNVLDLVDVTFEENSKEKTNETNVVESGTSKAAEVINDAIGDESKKNLESEDKLNKKEQTIEKISVNFTVLGDYKQTLNFLDGLEESERVCKITAVSMIGNNPTKTSGRVEFFFSKLDLKSEEYKYDFNNGTYGKENMFK